MKLSNLRKENRDEEIALVADVESEKFSQLGEISSKERTIWISVPKENAEYLVTDHYDGFLIVLLFCAMKYGEDIYIDGVVSKKLLKNIDYVQAILKSFTFYLNKINISVKETTDKKIEQATHIGTGFSGGVDCFCTIYDKFECESDSQYKVDTLVTVNIGHYGQADGKNQGNEERWKKNFCFLNQFAQEIGLPYIPVNSNFGAYIEKETFWQELRQFGPSFIAGVILSLQNRFSKYYIASNYSYLDPLRYAIKESINKEMVDGDYMENIFYHLLSTETLEIIVDGSQYSRTEKIKRISSYTPTYRYIDVGIRSSIEEKNNPNHFKTNRTLWTLETLNKLDIYSESFDISQWKKDAFQYKCEQMFFNKYVIVFVKENLELAYKHGKKVPPYIVAFLFVCFYTIPIKFAKGAIKFIDRKFYGKTLIPKIKNIIDKR
jgi:hypothetical protein